MFEDRPSDSPLVERIWRSHSERAGTFLPFNPAAALSDRKDVHLPGMSRRSFSLQGLAWEYPHFENAETLVTRLFRAGVLARDPAVSAALSGEWQALSRRSTQRHFLQATGITHVAYRQIQRARYATTLLERGVSIPDTIHQAGYFDQAHLTRSLRRLIGETPARLREHTRQLSFLYKTDQVGESTLARLQ